LSRIKTLDGPKVRGISPVGKEKVYGGKDLLKKMVENTYKREKYSNNKNSLN